MNADVLAQVVAVDSAALDAAASIAEEALACHREAMVLLAEGWQSETGLAIREFMEGQCVHAADVVDALRGAAGGTETPDVRADCFPPGGDRLPGGLPADLSGAVSAASGAEGPAEPITPTAPTAPTPAQPPAGTVSPSPWSMPTAADAPWTAAGFPGGPATPPAPAFPDFGGALAVLVAEIAHALGSYAAPSTEPGTAGQSADPLGSPHGESARPVAKDDDPAPLPTDAPAPASGMQEPENVQLTGPAATGATSPVLPPLEPAAPELLAAERPPDLAIAAAPAPAPDAAPAQPAPIPAPRPEPEASIAVEPSAAPAGSTPCEIAADELAKVGE